MSRLSFSIRDIFWLTFVVAIALAWWIDRGRYRYVIHEYLRWRGAAIGLASLMTGDGWHVAIEQFKGDDVHSFYASKAGRTFEVGKHGAHLSKPVGRP